MTFVAFEGGEGSGKSTQAARLAERLGAVLTREPGGTALGERIRALVLDHADVDPRTEALLMAAARAQHVAEVIAPALASGRRVVTDRFTGSSLAYQGVGRGLGVEEVAALSRFAIGGLRPDVTVVLDLPPELAVARQAGSAPDRIEAAGVEFHRRVRAAYLALAEADGSWVVVDGSGDAEAVAAAVWSAVAGAVGGGA